METPSSTRRVTRSQTLSAIKSSATNLLLSSKKAEEWDKCGSKSRERKSGKAQQERSALFDITNDSPIVGVAMQTPSRNMRRRIESTPGSGEALLRGQVKTLLHKVEEEADLTKISAGSRPFLHLVTSPTGLLAPTPANTPQVGVQIVVASPIVAGEMDLSLQVDETFEEEEEEEEECLEMSPSISRSLLLDFSDKSQGWEDDNSSVWSMQVNASTEDEEEDNGVYSCGEEEDGLCEGMRKMSFAGKHTRFVYDTEDEEILELSPAVLRLKGLPTPKGKHVRFFGS